MASSPGALLVLRSYEGTPVAKFRRTRSSGRCAPWVRMTSPRRAAGRRQRSPYKIDADPRLNEAPGMVDGLHGRLGVIGRRRAPTLRGSRARRGDRQPAREIGRRDWTRTNDPHHVKVVL